MFAELKRSSLKSVSKLTPKKFYEVNCWIGTPHLLASTQNIRLG